MKGHDVLVLEDDEDMQIWLETMFGDTMSMTFAGTLEAARKALRKRVFDLVIVDVELPDGEGTDIIREMREGKGKGLDKHRETPTLVMTANRTEAVFEDAWELGAVAYVMKPIVYDTMREAIERVL